MRVVKRTPRSAYRFPNPDDRYIPGGSFPWYRETALRPTQEEAWADAVAWAKAYEAKDRYGNMASAHGVIADGDGWRGVVNYFHSNT